MNVTISWRRRFSLGQVAGAVFDNPRLMTQVGEWVRDRVKERTLRGRDVKGRGFAPYTPAYAKRKGSSSVNLQLSGAMLDQITVTKAGPTSVTVDVVGDKRIVALRHHRPIARSASGRRYPTRQFMGLTQNQINQLKTFIRKQIRARARTVARRR